MMLTRYVTPDGTPLAAELRSLEAAQQRARDAGKPVENVQNAAHRLGCMVGQQPQRWLDGWQSEQ